jgi:hypothetical protein
VAESAVRFDPYLVLQALDRHRATYIVIGAFARVIHGTDEITRGIDIAPSTHEDNLRRLNLALEDVHARRADGKPRLLESDSSENPVLELVTDGGAMKVVPEPEGTRGYDDLRRVANREPLGQGVRPYVASPGDLARMLGALGREQDLEKLRMLRRLIELDRGRSRGIER